MGSSCHCAPACQVRTLEVENQRQSREVSALQAQCAQDAQQRQQSQREVLQLQKQVAEKEAAHKGAQKEVGALATPPEEGDGAPPRGQRGPPGDS